MHPNKPIRALAVAALLALALPASAAATPTVTTVVAKLGDPGVTFLTDPTGAALVTTQTQYVVSADGYAAGFAETNGLTSGGVIDYAVLPAGYRAPMSATDKLAYAPAQTGVQPHATCSGVAALADPANVAAWQRNAGDDPSYDYIPWQKTTAGLGDDPAKWIPVVRSATGVDLSTLATAADFRAACERLGGTYHAADAQSSIASALISNATAPLTAQIASLRRARDASDAAAATARAAATAARAAAATARAAQAADEAAYEALFTKPIRLTLAAKRFAPAAGVAMVTGSPTDPVDLTLEVTRKLARRLKLGTTVLAESEGTIDDDGGLLLALKPDAGVLVKLRTWWARHPEAKAPLAASVHAVSGGNEVFAAVKLTR